jgi:ubiquinone/menaquinone biosynthesis C-methylase UbiE
VPTSGERANQQRVREEFSRTAEAFNRRTRDRYDRLGVVEFSRARPGDRVIEVGAGGGGFLKHFRDLASLALACDLTPAMLRVARRDHPWMICAVGDGARLPFRDGSFELAASALAVHHMPEPLPVLREMARVATQRVLVVDQYASEVPAECAAQTELERLRDPSHAASRPPSVYRRLLRDAGLSLIDERRAEVEASLSSWTSVQEFPEGRVRAVRAFVEQRGHTTGMGFRRVGADWTFARRTLMLLAAPGDRSG